MPFGGVRQVHRRRIALILIFSLLASMLPLFAPTASAEYRSVTFQVVDGNNSSINNAVIFMERTDGHLEVVDYGSWYDNGWVYGYRQDYVDYGDYTVVAYAPGYDPVAYGTVTVGSSYTAPTIQFTAPDSSDVVSIPDDNLRTYLEGEVFGGWTEPITEHMMASVTYIDYYYSDEGYYFAIANAPISDLTGLEHAVNLLEIDLRGHDVSSLTPLANLPRLRTVTMSANPLTNIDTLSMLPSLTTIEIQNSQISSLPATLPPGITSIYLDGNLITDISVLATLTNLEYVSLNDNQIADMSALAALTRAERIELSNNSISAVPALHLPSLSVLYLDGNNISDLSGFETSYITELFILDLQYNQISADDLESLTYLPNLYSIDLRGNGLTSLSGLATNVEASLSWGRIDISENAITDLTPIARFSELYSLFASYNKITDMTPVTSLTGIDEIDLSHNDIAAIPAFPADSWLSTLKLSHNKISNFSSLNGLQHLDELVLDYNQIASLAFLNDIETPDFSFRTLDLSGNAFTSLAPMTVLTSVSWLYLNDSLFTDLSPLLTLKQNGGFTMSSSSLDLYGASVDFEAQQNIISGLGIRVNYSGAGASSYAVNGVPLLNPTAGHSFPFRIGAHLYDEINYWIEHEIRVRITKDGTPVDGEQFVAARTHTNEPIPVLDGELRLYGGTGELLLNGGILHDIDFTFADSGEYGIVYEMWVNTQSGYSGYMYKAFEDAQTLVVGGGSGNGTALSSAEAGSIVSFGGKEWVLIDPEKRQLLLRSLYGAPRAWEPDFYSSSIVSDPAFRYDPERTGSIAYDLNRTFLESLDVGGGEDQWIVPHPVRVPYLTLYEDGTVEEKGSPAPYYVADTTKVNLLTYEEYRAALDRGALVHGDGRLLDWDAEWFLANPITEEYFTHQYHAFVNTDGSIYYYPTDLGVRPVVLLRENVEIAGGNGSAVPYTLAMPAPAASVQQSEQEVGALTDVRVEIVANRTIEAGEEVTISFPAGYDVSYLPEYSGIEVSVGGGPPAVVEGVTTVGNDVFVPMPIGANDGDSIVVYFPGDSGIHNAVTAGSHLFRISVPGANEASPAYVTLIATLDAYVSPSSTADSAANVGYAFTYTMPAFQPLPAGATVAVTFPAGYTVPSAIDAAHVIFYYYEADASLTAPASAVHVSGNQVWITPPGALPESFTLVFEPEAGIGNPAAPGTYTIASTVSTATVPASMPVTIEEALDPDLTIQMVREDDYYLPGLLNRQYTITVTNEGEGPTSGTVTVEADFASGLTLTSLTGTGWSCSIGTGTCTRSDLLVPGDSYPPMIATVNVAAGIGGGLLNAAATVSGGGDVNSYNNSTGDEVTVIDFPVIELSVPGSETWGKTASVKIDVTKTDLGLPLNEALFAYTWSETPAPPEGAEWTPFGNGETVTLEGKTGHWHLHVRAGDADGNLAFVSSARFRLDNIAPTFSPWFYKLTNGSAYTPGTWTNVSVGIDGNYFDFQSGLTVLQYSADGGETYAPFWPPIHVTEEGEFEYRFRAVDAAGNETLNARTVKIDKTAPSLDATLKRADGLPYVPGTLTNQAVTLEAIDAVDERSGVSLLQYSLNDGPWLSTDEFVPISENGTHSLRFRATDAAGNVTETSPATIRIALEALTLDLSTTSTAPTNGTVEVTAGVTGGIGPYTFKWAAGIRDPAYFAEAGTGFTDIFAVSENGDYTVFVVDAAGNASVEAINIVNIVREPPDIGLSAPTTPTNGSVTITVSTSAARTDIGNAVQVVKWLEGEATPEDFAGGGADITEALSFTVSQNGTYSVYAKDAAGNAAVAHIVVSAISTEAPSLELGFLPIAPTNGTVEVTAGVTGGIGPYVLKWAEGEQTISYFAEAGTGFTESFSVIENGEYTVYVIDAAGNEAVEVIGVENIVRVPPNLALTPSTTSPTNGSVFVTVDADVYGMEVGNGVQIVKWLEGEAALGDFDSGGTDITETMNFEAAHNGWYTVFVKDLAGNAAIERIFVGNISVESPTLEVGIHPTTPTNGSVHVFATAYGGLGPYVFKWAGGVRDSPYFAEAGIGFTDTFGVGENGDYTVYVRDSAGNSAVEVVHVNAIVRDAPILELTASPTHPTNGNVVVTVSASVYGAEAGNAVQVVKWLEGEAAPEQFASGGHDITQTLAFAASQNGWYTVFVQDAAGNIAVKPIAVANINAETPGVSVHFPGAPTNGPVEVSVTASVYGTANSLLSLLWIAEDGSEEPLAFVEIDEGDEEQRTYYATVIAAANGSYLVKAIDAAGNEKTQTVDIGHIITTPPSILLSTSAQPTSGARIFVDLQAAGAMNAIAATKWAPGQWTAADYERTPGHPGVPPSYYFTVYENGWYTVFAKDLAGNVQAASIRIDTVQLPPAENPNLLFAAVGDSPDRVRLVFDRPLDRYQALSPALFGVYGVNAFVSGVYYDAADPKTIWLALDANEDIVWQSGAAVSAAADAVRTPSGGFNGAVSGLRVVTPTVVAEVTASIDTTGGGIEVRKLITFMRGGAVDLNQDGVTDKGDIAFVLELIPSVTFRQQ